MQSVDTTNLLIGIGVGAIVIGAAGGVAYYVAKHKKEEDDKKPVSGAPRTVYLRQPQTFVAPVPLSSPFAANRNVWGRDLWHRRSPMMRPHH